MAKRSKNEKFKTNLQTKNKQSKQGAKSNASTNPDRKLTLKQANAPVSHMRSKQTIKRLRLYNEKPDYDNMYKQSKDPARIDPNRKWFGNVRTIDQPSLEKFRQEMANRQHDPRSVLIRAKKLPVSLLVEKAIKKKSHQDLLQLESYGDTFGPKSRRKRVKINQESLQELAQETDMKEEKYEIEKDKRLNQHLQFKQHKELVDLRLKAGQSKRIWEELYKVIDASDVLCVILDARDPLGTRVYHIENHIKNNCPHKHLVFLLNKCDLIPTWLTSRWVQYLSKEYPTLAYNADLQRPFGKGPFINLIRQFDKFHQDKQTIQVGFIGYPNVGKSSVINSLKKSKVCKAAPIPGETRVWQYVTLTKRIYLIDCPGVVYSEEGTNTIDVVLKGCVRAERLEDPTYFIPAILEKANRSTLEKLYEIKDWEDDEEFLKMVGKKKGKLLKGGEPDVKTAAKLVVMDWQRGVIPYYQLPPNYEVNKKKKVQEEEEEEQNKIIQEQDYKEEFNDEEEQEDNE